MFIYYNVYGIYYSIYTHVVLLVRMRLTIGVAGGRGGARGPCPQSASIMFKQFFSRGKILLLLCLVPPPPHRNFWLRQCGWPNTEWHSECPPPAPQTLISSAPSPLPLPAHKQIYKYHFASIGFLIMMRKTNIYGFMILNNFTCAHLNTRAQN